ncbi:hypothetical protein QQF64_026266 [Cirrhinus molitorella]|uniref:Uncharacterized protein n=1 Tax=Cirrhinus molitorella TaxID=172907 RepID=A0ABR3NSE5_9TELE
MRLDLCAFLSSAGSNLRLRSRVQTLSGFLFSGSTSPAVPRCYLFLSERALGLQLCNFTVCLAQSLLKNAAIAVQNKPLVHVDLDETQSD